MATDKKIIKALNQVLTGQLTAINQYFLHAKMCGDWGYGALHGAHRKASIVEMKNAEKLTERILFLGGLPNLQRLDKINIGETVAEQLQSDLDLTLLAAPRLNQAIEQCADAGDNGSRLQLEAFLAFIEDHIDWLETQLEQIDTLGLAKYLAEQLG